MNLEYRLASPQDLPRLAEINSLGSKEGLILAEKELPKWMDDGHLICAVSDNQIIGLLYWEEKFFGNPKYWFLTQITTDEKLRRKGIGEMLFKYFLSFAKDKGIEKIFADIPISNTASRGLIKKLGALNVGSIDLGDGDQRLYFRFDL